MGGHLVDERALREVVVPAAHGGAIEVRAGEYLRRRRCPRST